MIQVPSPSVPNSFDNLPMPRPGEIANIPMETFMRANENDEIGNGTELPNVGGPEEQIEQSGTTANVIGY